MIIEVLYSDICNLFGEPANVRYLEKCMPKAKFIYTDINEEPYFINNKVNLIYMGPTTEKYQELIIEKLTPYKDKIKDLIENNTPFLIMNNAFDIFCKEIVDKDRIIKCLNIFDVTVKRDMFKRKNCLYLGTFENSKIVGFKSQFNYYYTDDDNYLFETIKGFGRNENTSKEGYHYKNFISTHVLGPILLSNPPFTKYILKTIGVKKPLIAFDKATNDVYKTRIKELSR